uniref:Uncharacterized protein n=1 Tax=Candidatus Kentrum sp. DK TaxID=2126562 RepID=A0A450RYJ7_9GAMM|nr:MAG: hypothetical protein BECKDK2373B_GA0170837_100725 [Candidatus Kentron sp. DK]
MKDRLLSGYRKNGASERLPRKDAVFSVRETLLSEGSADSIFRQCLLDAKRFIDANSVSDLLHWVFEGERSRKVVRESVHDFLHVGFISPHRDLDDMAGLSEQVGFSSGFSTVTSAVVSRELGYLEGGGNVPTSLFTAKLGSWDENTDYVEVFLPDAPAPRIREWVNDEVGTHVGLILKAPSALPGIRAAFHDERFQVAPFMGEEGIRSPGKAASVIYYERPYGVGKFRVEIFCPDEG